MAPTHVQVVEGNPHLRSLLGWHLQQNGYSVHLTANMHQGRDVFLKQRPNLVVIDSDLPDGHGLELCRWLHRQNGPLILFISAENNENHVVKGLGAGADDYLRKPFGIQEFLARIHALERRSRPVLPSQLRYGDLRIDLVQRRVHYNRELVELTPQEFSLIFVLAQAEGKALSRSELLERAWPDNIDNPRTVDTHVLSLRKKIEISPQQPQLIQTVRNVGYRLNLEYLQEPDTVSSSGVGLSSNPRLTPFTQPQQSPLNGDRAVYSRKYR
ncbi:response regulator transcription factor [Lyngbya confervoides]|uniref:Response regulator transcription factor n=1 Tax=Lyngbya confervoides BDU141951 TaxID=1574623 RepID=A0ABD4T725_9CYAN|nr:response regulator transcription factor [Lyngbya confervoides]MCM1984382.1 response regulator transcription factor [Lyngbya confervoides BDU141951]